MEVDHGGLDAGVAQEVLDGADGGAAVEEVAGLGLAGLGMAALRTAFLNWRWMDAWWNYFQLADWRREVRDLSGWIRRHMRKCFWQRWLDGRQEQRYRIARPMRGRGSARPALPRPGMGIGGRIPPLLGGRRGGGPGRSALANGFGELWAWRADAGL